MSSSPFRQREVMVRSQESAESTTSGETKDPHPIACRWIAETVNSSCGTGPHLDRFKDHQPECEAVQFKESDKEASINAAEQEAVSGPVGIFSHVTQDSAVSDRLQPTVLALESANLHEIDTALTEVLHEVKRANVTKNEAEEHSIDIRNETQDQPNLEGPVIKLLEDLDMVENRNEATSSPEPQTSHKDQSFPNPYYEHSLDVNGDGMLFQETEETRMDPKSRDDHPDRISGSILDHLEETCFNGDTDESENLEPPTKKRLRRRMGMCGLGDRKRKFPFDGQYCRRGLAGRQREEGAGKGNVEYTVLENDGTTPMDHVGSTRPVCEEDDKVLIDKGNNGAEVMDDKITTGVEEKKNRYALRNTSKCTALMNDEVTTENENLQKKGILEENNCTITMDDKGAAEQMVLEHELNLLEDISTLVGQTLLSPPIGKNLNMIQDEPSLAAVTNNHEMETATCGDEPNFPGPDRTNSGQDKDFNMKHDADNKVHEDPDEIATEVQIAQEVSSRSVCAIVETSEGSVIVNKEVQEVPSGLEESETEMEEQPNMAATEKLDPNRNDLSRSTEKCLHPLFDKLVTVGSDNIVPAGGLADMQISEPIAPPTGQENHVHCLLDQNVCVTSVTPSVAEQQVCNPTLTPAANELPQETCIGLSAPSLLYSVTDSQLHKTALRMEPEDQPIPEGGDQQEDATELVRGLIRELSSLNRTVMAAHREMELLRRGKPPKTPNRRTCGARHTEV